MGHLISAWGRFFLVVFSFVSIGMLFWRCRGHFKREWREIPCGYLLVLGVFSVVMIVLLLWMTHFLFFVDIGEWQSGYEVAVQRIITQGHLGDLSKSEGWAFLIFLGVLLGLPIKHSIVLIGGVLSLGTIIGVFFLGRWADLSRRASGAAAGFFAFAVIRSQLLLSGESHAGALFFVVWAVAVAFLFYRLRDKGLFYLMIFLWIGAIFVRGETILLAVFFLGCSLLFLPWKILKQFPWRNAFFLMAIVLGPHVLTGIGNIVNGHRMSSQPDISLKNFFYNSYHYGGPFLAGRAHPALLTVFALIGAGYLYVHSRKFLGVLAGWLAIVSLIYFSMWMQVYDESVATSFYPKITLFIHFYPPLALLSGVGMVWFLERHCPSFIKLAAMVLCGAMLIFYWSRLQADVRAYLAPVGDSRSIQAVIMHPESVPIGCHQGIFRDRWNLNRQEAADDFLDHAGLRAWTFDHTREVFLIEQVFLNRMAVFNDHCQEAIPVIKEKGRAVMMKQIAGKDVIYKIYLLSRF